MGETEAKKGCEAEPMEVEVSYRLSTVAAKCHSELWEGLEAESWGWGWGPGTDPQCPH